MARSRYKILENDQPYFPTCTIVHWLPLLANPRIVDIIMDSLRFLQESHRWKLYAYVIMEDHLHLIASAHNLSKEIGDFKSFTARSIINYLQETQATSTLSELKRHKLPHKKDRSFQVWQEGSHPQLIRGTKVMKQKIEYIHSNPVKKGLVDDPMLWIYSSIRNYEGLKGLIKISMDW